MLTPGLYQVEVDLWSAGCIFAELLYVSHGHKSSDVSHKQLIQLRDTAGPFLHFQKILEVLGPPSESFFNNIESSDGVSFLPILKM